MQGIEWTDEPIIIKTDTDGNYSGVLVKDIDRLLAWPRGEDVKITYYVERTLPPVDHAWINEALDLMIVVKDMEADSFQTQIVVSASADVSAAASTRVLYTGPIEKTFYITFRKPRE